ncbi:MAG: hypothetical protein ACOYUZ_06000 [Patescibacteria group bacterium]
MLEHLFGSKTRVKLLALFLNEPNQAYFIRELTRLIDTQINAVRREIDNLTRMGMLIESEDVSDNGQKRPGLKRKYYQINPQFPLLSEIQSLMNKSHFLMERRLDKEIASTGEIEYMAFLGVFLGEKAPVDLFIVGTVDKDSLQRIIRQAENSLGYEINFTCLTPQEYAYRQDIADRFLAAVLNASKHVAVDKITQKKAAQ